MKKTEKIILFAEELPDYNYNDDVYNYFESEFIKSGNLIEIIEAIRIALTLGCIDELNEVINIYKG